MGQEKHLTFPSSSPPWPAVAAALADLGCPVEMRMIDGELAFPDETPPDSWRELRVAAAGAMITIRRDGDAIRLIAWGNPDAAQQRLWDALERAYRAAAGERGA